MNDGEDEPERGGWLRHLATWIATFAGIVLLVQVIGWLRAPDLPEAAPPFALPDLDGNVVTLDDFAGRTVVLNFWATWCGPCRVEIPSFSAYARAHPDVVVLGIAADGPASRLRAFARQHDMSYAVLQGDARVLSAYGIGTYPTTVVIRPDGTVKHAHVGPLLRPQLAWLTGKLW